MTAAGAASIAVGRELLLTSSIFSDI